MIKRGMSHIEMILAFILFIFALIVSLQYIELGGQSSILETTQALAVRIIEENTSIEVKTYSLIMLPVMNRNITTSVKLEGNTGSGVRVSNYTGTALSNVTKEGEFVYFDWNDSYGNFISLQTSEDFPAPAGKSTGKPSPDSSYYNFSSVFSEKLISENKLKALTQEYHNNYIELKRVWNIPESSDFAFQLYFSSSDFISTFKKPPEGIDVLSSKFRKEVLRVNGARIFADLGVKVW